MHALISQLLVEVGLKINSEFISSPCKRKTQPITYCVHNININPLIGEKPLLLSLRQTEISPFIVLDREI